MHHLDRAYKGKLEKVDGHCDTLPVDIVRKSSPNTLRGAPLPDFKHEVPNKTGVKHTHAKYSGKGSSRMASRR